jgi:amino acid adenylation domain-containing protein
MTTIQEFMSYLRSINVKVWIEDADQLRYKGPREKLTADVLAKMRERKEEIISFCRSAAYGSDQTGGIEPAPRHKPLPLSAAQKRLWFLYHLEGPSPTYNIHMSLRLKGPLDVNAFKESLSAIVHRHEVMRTTFVEETQRVAQTLPLPFSIVDLQSLPESDRAKEARKLAETEALRPFNLTECPLFCFTLFQLGKQDHVFLLVIHHIISDGRSMDVFKQELAAFYMAFKQGEVPALSPLPVQYADFTYWHQAWLSQEVIENQLSYWKKQLAQMPPLLHLPTDKPRPAVQSFHGSVQFTRIGADLTQKLHALSQRSGVSLFMTLASALAILLFRYTSQEDIAIGVPVENRSKKEIEPLIGFFVNTLVLRVDISQNPTFHGLLKRVQHTALDAYDHQDVPFEKVVEALQPERSLSHMPLFQVMLVFLNEGEEGKMELPDLAVEPFYVELLTAKCDITLEIHETDSGLDTMWTYNRDIFERSTIMGMIEHLQILLEAIVAHPERHVSELPLLSEAEQHKLLIQWNDTRIEYPQKLLCVHKMVEAQVEATPEAVAVEYEGQRLTYRQLNQKANHMAHYLQSVGVKPEARVGICVDRSLDMVVALLGIVKAGGAYVPLDPAYPEQRIAFMVLDSEASVLITQQKWLNILPQTGKPVVCLDRDWPLILQSSQDNNPIGEVTSENLAYVIYTSGSTGTPKAVAMEHGPLTNLILWQNSKALRTLQFTSLSFDVSFQEIFSTWCSGGTLVLVSEQTRLDAEALLSFIKNTTIERLFLPFVALQHLAETAQRLSEIPTELHEIITAGEQLQITPHITSFFAKLTGCRMYNQYGPSETHVVTSCLLAGSVHDWPSLPPIGRPVANTQIYILDTHLQPVPIGVAGELYIGGTCLARGYLNRPELTHSKFISNPFNPGARLYRTGDLARYLPDGNIEFLGRMDNQVKIRGFRIEPGEIEAALAGHPGVDKAVVTVWEEQPPSLGSKMLVAYVVPNPDTDGLSSSQLSSFLKKKLPHYMVPSRFVMLQTLPTTPSGKIDRKALPAIGHLKVNSGYISPSTPTEEILAGIWAEVLRLEQNNVESHHNFFELGGHSLLVTQVVSRIRDAFSIELPVRRLFEFPTIAKLSRHIETMFQEEATCQVPPIKPRIPGNDTELPLSFAQERLWFLNQLEGDSPTYNMPSALRLMGKLNVAALHESLKAIVDRHESLRTSFPMVNGKPVQRIVPDLSLSMPVIDLQGLVDQEKELYQLAHHEAKGPFDLTQAPLVRAVLYRLHQEDHVIVVTMHHIASDGWSIEVFIRELAALYRAFCLGMPSPLPPLPIQYADYAYWQRQWLQGQLVLEKQLKYWLNQMKGAPSLLDLPLDRSRPTVQSFKGRAEKLHIPPDLIQRLKTINHKFRATMFMTLQTAFVTLLFRYSFQDDIVIGCPVANRSFTEIEPLIGLFTNFLPLRTDLSGNPQFQELLERNRTMILQAYAHQDLPFEKLVEALQPKRELRYTPLFQVALVFQNASMRRLDLHGLHSVPFDLEITTAPYDLLLSVEETEQEGIEGAWVYNTDIFEKSSIVQMAAHYRILLEEIVNNPQVRILDIVLERNNRNQTLQREEISELQLENQQELFNF